MSNSFDLQTTKQDKKDLRQRLTLAIFALIVAIAVAVTVTFAWYIYNTNSRTTKVHMAAGSSTVLEIANKYDGLYSSSCDLSAFNASLNPVSTDDILHGFQKVYGFTDGSENQPRLLANIFGPSSSQDYFETSVFIRTNAQKHNLYVSNIAFKEKDEKNPISTAIRIGLVTHQPGERKPVANQYVFSISDKHNPKAEYNTFNGEEGHVLDSTKTDGSTVPFTPYTKANYASYDESTGKVTIDTKSLKIGEIQGKNGKPGDSIQVDIYIWLEGCDSDCVDNICNKRLSDIAVSFAAHE